MTEKWINKIICGDSLELTSQLSENFVNLIIISSPYFGCRVYGDETLGRESHPLDYVKHLLQFMDELRRVLHPARVFLFEYRRHLLRIQRVHSQQRTICQKNRSTL